MVGRPVVQALHGDDDGGGLALGPEPAEVVAGNQAGELLDALVDLASFPLIEVLAAERGQDQSTASKSRSPRHGRGSMASRRPRCITSVNDRDTSNPDTCWPRTGFKRVRLVFR
jgi:hypothetical protein